MIIRKPYIPRLWQPPITNHILTNPRCNIFAGMGTGKTTAALTAVDLLFLSGMETKPVLVIAPLRVAMNTWPDEAAKWKHLKDIVVQPIIGSVEERKAALHNTKANVFTINYENIQWLVEYLGDKWPFGMVIADESTKLKGFRLTQGTKRARALARVAHSKCTRWVNLTGTPSPNGLKDLWGQNWFVDAGRRLGRTFTDFQNRWFQMSFDGFTIKPLPFAQVQIQDRIKDISLSIDIADYVNIDKPIIDPRYVELPKRARILYRDMEKEMFMQINEHDVEAFGAAARTNKCLQLANGAVYVGEDAVNWEEVHDEKIQALEEIIEEAAGMPVLVAYNFRSDLERLRKAFPKGRVLDKDTKTISAWNAGAIPILFAHPASAGHGLNLQDGGNILAIFGHNWNLEEYQQIIERIGPTRQMQAGHNRPVFIYPIIAKQTVDELVVARRESKREVQDILLEAMKQRRN